MAEWTKAPGQAVLLDDLFRDREISGKTFLKIDTQGHEKHVLAGFESTMRNRRDWLIKMEFAPKWLRSQGTEPASGTILRPASTATWPISSAAKSTATRDRPSSGCCAGLARIATRPTQRREQQPIREAEEEASRTERLAEAEALWREANATARQPGGGLPDPPSRRRGHPTSHRPFRAASVPSGAIQPYQAREAGQG